MVPRRLGRVRICLLAGLAASSMVLTACGGGSSSDSAAVPSNGPTTGVTISVALAAEPPPRAGRPKTGAQIAGRGDQVGSRTCDVSGFMGPAVSRKLIG